MVLIYICSDFHYIFYMTPKRDTVVKLLVCITCYQLMLHTCGHQAPDTCEYVCTVGHPTPRIVAECFAFFWQPWSLLGPAGAPWSLLNYPGASWSQPPGAS